MFNAFLKPQEEKFLVLIVTESEKKGFLLGAKSDRTLSVLKKWNELNLERFFTRWHLLRRKWSVIVAAGTPFVFTAVFPIFLKREEAGVPLSEGELDNLFGKTASAMFNQYREEASRTLHLKEADVVLIESRIYDFKIDDHLVLDPLGFVPKKLEATVELTFVKRDLYEHLRPLIRRRASFRFLEATRAGLYALKKISKGDIGIISIKANGSFALTFDKKSDRRIRVQDLGWAANVFEEMLSGEWSLSPRVAREVYLKYLNGNISPLVGKYLKKLFKPMIQNFLSSAAQSGFRGRFFIDTSEQLPFPLPYRRRGITFESLPVKELARKSGFEIDTLRWPMESGDIFSCLAPFFEYYYDKGDNVINHWLKRRLHWLGARPV